MKTKQTSKKSHVNWSETKYAAGGFVRGLAKGMGRLDYANEYFEEPHPKKPTGRLPKGMQYPGFKQPKMPKSEAGKELTPDMSKPYAPAELRPRKRRSEQEI